MNERAPSLELPEVSRRFEESERLLREARERLTSILESETRSQRLTDSLSESARTVSEFASRAEAVLRETQSAVQEARAVLQAGSAVISGNALSELREQVSELQEEASRLGASIDKNSSALITAVRDSADAHQKDHERTDGRLEELTAVLRQSRVRKKWRTSRVT